MKHAFLARWVEDLKDFAEVIDKVRLDDGAVYISLVKSGTMLILLSPADSFIYLSNEIRIPKEAHEIWSFLRNSKISSIRIKEDDRIIYMDLHYKDIYGEARDYEMVIELMPPKPNVILIKKDTALIQDALVKYSLADNPMRMVLVNQPYYPPKTSFKPDPPNNVEIPEGFDCTDINSYFAKKHQEILKPHDRETDIRQKLKVVNKERKRLQKKLKLQEQDLANAEKAEYYHACAEAIKPNMSQIAPGQESLTTINYLDPEMKDITIDLHSDKSPRQNLAYYIKKYQKAKNGLSIIKLNLARTKSEIDAISKLISRLESGADIDLEIKGKTGGITQRMSQVDKVLQFRYSDDWQIYIGRKAKENDFVTTKLGKAQDWWFHSRIYRGAHVLARNYKKKSIPDELIEICCSLAAWYSQAKFSVNVPVDYTQIRYVRKPKGSPAGFVTYTNYKTVFANPRDLRSIKRELDHD